jgi:uncharacterized membrane protein
MPNGPTNPAPQLLNVQAIADFDLSARRQRSRIESLTDRISAASSHPFFVLIHLLWFSVWVGLNVIRPAFDPFPFSLLTLVVSLEAIVLSGFLLMAQNLMTRQADRRAQLDLQINLLAEQELTAILKLLCQVAERVGIDIGNDPKLAQFRASTDVQELGTLIDATLDSKAKRLSSSAPTSGE